MIEEVLELIPPNITGDLRETITSTARALDAESSELGLRKLQRFIDYTRAAELLAEVLPIKTAVRHHMEREGIERLASPGAEPSREVLDLVASFREAAVRHLIERTDAVGRGLPVRSLIVAALDARAD